MKKQESNFYEKYWQEEDEDVAFQEIPVWGDLRDLKKLTDFFKPAIKGKILDIGCGEGDWVLHLSQFPQVNNVVGVDISRNAISKAVKKARAKKITKKIKFTLGEITALPFKSSNFDNLFSIAVLEHILDIDKTFREFNRVLKIGGHVGVLTVDLNFLKRVIIGTLFFEKYFDPRSPHIRFFTKRTLSKLFERYGFEVKNYKWLNSYFGIMPLAQIMLAQKVRNI